MRKILKLSLIIIAFFGIVGILNISFLNSKEPKGSLITYGGPGRDCDSPYGIEKISENEYLIIGTSNSFGKSGEDDALLINIDVEGKVNFAEIFGGIAEDRLHKVARTENGDFIGVGYSCSRKGLKEYVKDLLLVRFDKRGKLMWSKILNAENDQVGYSVVKTKDGNFVAVGWEGEITGKGQDILVVKFNEEGEIIFAKILGTPDDEEQSYSVASTDDGGALIFGKKGVERMEALGHSNLLLIKLDSKGNVDFAKTIGQDVYYYLISPTAIEKIKDGYLLAAETYSPESGKDGVIIKLNGAGDIIFTKIIGTLENNERFRSAIQTEDGNYLVVGDLYNYSKSEGLLVKLDKNGKLIDSRTFSGKNRGEINRLDNIKEVSDGYLISGKTNFYGAGDFDNVIIKIDKSLGSSKCNLIKKEIRLFKKNVEPKENLISLKEENALDSMEFSDIIFDQNDVTEVIQSSVLCE